MPHIRCGILLSLLAMLLTGCSSTRLVRHRPININVQSFGAVGDGTTSNTAAFQRALDAASAHSGTVQVPAGKYLIGSIQIKSNTTLAMQPGATLQGSADPADYPLTTVRFEGEDVPGHRALIWAEHAHDIAIVGTNRFADVGPSLIAGSDTIGTLRRPRGPVMIEFTDCTHVQLDDFSETYRRLWSIHLLYCHQVTAENLHIRTTGNNGDGIDVDSSTSVIINHCDIDTGDDCISLKSGRGAAAVRAHRPTENVLIENCILGSSFAGVGIGTEMSGGVEHVRILNCRFTHGVNAIFLKSRSIRGGYLRDIYADHLTAESGIHNFLGIGLNNHGIIGTEPITGDAGIPEVRDIVIRHVVLHNVGRLVDGAHVDPAKPVNNLVLTDITGTARRGIQLMNVTNANLQNIQVTGYTGPFLETQNVTGAGLEGAVPLPTHNDERRTE